jgi:hypothetical protein
VTISPTRAAADALRRALAQRLGIASLSTLDNATDLPWLLHTAGQILDAATRTDAVQRPDTVERIVAAAGEFTDSVGGPAYPDERDSLFGRLRGAVTDHRAAVEAAGETT